MPLMLMMVIRHAILRRYAYVLYSPSSARVRRPTHGCFHHLLDTSSRGARESLVAPSSSQFLSFSSSSSSASSSSSPTSTSLSSARRLVSLAYPEGRLIAASMGTLGVTSSISLILPGAVGIIIDSSLGAEGSLASNPTLLAGGLFSLFSLQAIMNLARGSMLAVAGERLVTRLRKQVFASMVSQEMAYLDKRQTGELVNRLSADTQLVQKSITSNVVQGMQSGVMMTGGSAMLVLTSPSLALLSLCILPPLFLTAKTYGKFIKERQKEIQDELAITTSVAEEVFTNLSTVRQFAAEPLEVAKYGARVDRVYVRASKAGLASATFQAGVTLALNCSIVAVLTYGAQQVTAGDLTAGALTSFLMYSLMVGGSVAGLAGSYSEVMKGIGASTRILDIIDRKPRIVSSMTSPYAATITLPPLHMHNIINAEYEDQSKMNSEGKKSDDKTYGFLLGASFFDLEDRDPVTNLHHEPYGTSITTESAEGNRSNIVSSMIYQQVGKSGYTSLLEAEKERERSVAPIVGDIVFEDVSFAYPTRPDIAVLKNLSLHIKQGTNLALVGASGSGKSTLAALLTRLYEPDTGRIVIDGVDIREIDPHWLRLNIGVVAQEPLLFSGTIQDNIRYGLPDATSLQVQAVSSSSHADEFIESFPDGIETWIGERGTQLSGGQKQRIAIARMLLKDPPIIVLDEATSALDAQAEHLVQQALASITNQREGRNRSILSIAHRLSTIRAADEIAVLGDGCIVERGSYDMLRHKEGGAFNDLIRRQATHNA